MNAAQIHLALNHVPIALVLFAIPLLGVALWRNSRELKKTALAFFIAGAVAAVPVFLTGHETEETVEDRPGVSEVLIHQHEEAAELALTAVEILGALSLGFWLFQRFRKPVAMPYWMGLAGVALVTLGLFLRTAHLGGQITHSEIRRGAVVQLGETGERGEERESTRDDD